MDDKLSTKRVVNTVFRFTMRLTQVGFVCIAIWGPGTCNETLYPWTFLVLIWTLVIHNLYDLFLYNKNYLVNLNKMPPMSANRLRFNKELFLA